MVALEVMRTPGEPIKRKRSLAASWWFLPAALASAIMVLPWLFAALGLTEIWAFSLVFIMFPVSFALEGKSLLFVLFWSLLYWVLWFALFVLVVNLAGWNTGSLLTLRIRTGNQLQEKSEGESTGDTNKGS